MKVNYNIKDLIYMGNQNCQHFEGKTYQNQAYGQFEIIDQNQKEIARIVKVIEKRRGLKQLIQTSLKKRVGILHQNLCKLYSYKFYEEELIFQIVLNYEYHPKTLADKIASQKMSNLLFPHRQLLKIIQQVSSALKQLNRNNMKHGCINLNTILCCQQGYKITDISSTSYLSTMELAQKGSKTQPLSRKIIKFINDISLKCIVHKQLTIEDDLFSLGMIILSIGTDTDIGQFYSYQIIQERLSISLKELTICNYLFLLKKRYDKNLEAIVRKLLFSQGNFDHQSLQKISTKKYKRVNENSSTKYDSDFSLNIQEF